MYPEKLRFDGFSLRTTRINEAVRLIYTLGIGLEEIKKDKMGLIPLCPFNMLHCRASPDVAHRAYHQARIKKPTFAFQASMGEVGAAGQISNQFLNQLIDLQLLKKKSNFNNMKY